MKTQIPLDVSLALHDWLEMCRTARDEPSEREIAEHLAALLKARAELDAECMAEEFLDQNQKDMNS